MKDPSARSGILESPQEFPLSPAQSPEGNPRALLLLAELRARQGQLPRPAALAWERTVFAEALDHPEPHRRIQAFLGESRLSE